jgi:predicted lipoprotein with Yx(FWY)xxD motif
MKRVLLILIASIGLVAAGCGDDDSDEASSATANGKQQTSQPAANEQESAEQEAAEQEAAEPAARRRGPRVKLRDSQFGPVLFDGRDRALYLFTRDRKNTTRCYGACAEAWPPFYAKGRPRAGRGVDRDLLGTIKRRDGRRQVTYKGQPLYFYVHDPKGQVLCNDVVEFGGTWFALDAEGDPPA